MKKLTILMTFFVLLSSCYQVTDALIDGAISGAGRAVSERAANAVYKKLAPKEKLPAPSTMAWNQYMVAQAQIIFSYTFAPGGLWVSKNTFDPGEYTKFRMTEDGENNIIIERAYLKKLENGNQWWRSAWEEGEDKWIYEALISADDGQLLRLRARDVDGNEGEIPVTDQTITISPTTLSEESIEGATIDAETIESPAGTFQTDHVQYMAVDTDGAIDWWISDEVPGGVVKYQLTDKDDEIVWTNILIEKGSDATTILNSF